MKSGGLVTKLSPRSVPETVARLSELVESKSLTLFGIHALTDATVQG